MISSVHIVHHRSFFVDLQREILQTLVTTSTDETSSATVLRVETHVQILSLDRSNVASTHVSGTQQSKSKAPTCRVR